MLLQRNEKGSEDFYFSLPLRFKEFDHFFLYLSGTWCHHDPLKRMNIYKTSHTARNNQTRYIKQSKDTLTEQEKW